MAKGERLQQEATPQIVVQQEPVAEAELPDFSKDETPPPSQPVQQATPGQPQLPGVQAAEMVAPLIVWILDNVDASLRERAGLAPPASTGPPGPFTDPEKQALAQTWGAVANKYLPDIMQRWGIEVACVLTTATIVGTKLWSWWSYRKQRETLDKAAVEKQAEANVAGFKHQAHATDDALKDQGEAWLRAQAAREASFRGG